MFLAEILRRKGHEVYSISSEATMAEVVASMVDLNCGSLVVLHGRRMVGIITERDVLRTAASDPRPLEMVGVEERMSREVITGRTDQTVEQVMGLLTNRRIRHLPVVDDGELVGMISIGDVVKAQHRELSQENHFLKAYIHS